jgi:uroporphyrin-III C-methyltransferase / precorrin-2 dehydrogenase / sirohydrochlorin ferrochelatase
VTFYPVCLNLRGRRAVVIGGGAVAEQKVLGLLAAGARVTVVSPDRTARLSALAAEGGIQLRHRTYRSGDLAGAWLAIAATDDRGVNARVWAEAERAGILLNAVDDTEHCSFIAPAIHRAGDITVAVSTAGKSPALAARLRERVARSIGPVEARLCALLGELRPELAARVPDARARTALWYRIVDSDVIEFVRRGDMGGARQRVEELVRVAIPNENPSSDVPRLKPGLDTALPLRAVLRPAHPSGCVYLVGAGPGDPGLITSKGLEILRSADVVVYDRLVALSLVAEAPAAAERVSVGKHPHTAGAGALQEGINALLVQRAREGKTVVRLKGGDPFVFGRGAEECEALHAAGVRFEVVPGVTSAVAAPASAGIPVTHRRYGSAFAVVTGHECDGASDLDWSALARLPTLVVLMGVRALPEIVARLVRHGLEPDTPAAVIASATLADARTIVGTLASIAELAREAGIEAPATLVVGNVVRVRERLAGAERASTASAHLAGTGPMRQRTVAVATTSPAASAMTDSKSCSASRDVSGKGQRASAVRRPRAFFR